MIETRYIAHSGDDLMVVNAARVSFAKESEWEAIAVYREDFGPVGVESKLSGRDLTLIRYLAEHAHWTPFAHPQITLHVKAPIFVRAQCFKHKVGFVENEVSRRYVDDEPEFFVPEVWRGRATDKKQGSTGEVPRFGPTLDYQHAIETAFGAYRSLLKQGVAPEQARMVLPQSMMTEWYWSGSLAAWARFCRQRMGKDAQAETGDVARQCAAIIATLFPVSWAALVQ